MSSAIIASADQLVAWLGKRSLTLSAKEQQALRQAVFPLRLPVHYAELIDWNNPADPLKKIALPQLSELNRQTYELTDPIGDQAHEAIPGLIHRYPDRALLLLTTYCHIHCRFCFRREVVSQPRRADIKLIEQYLQQHSEIQEIIFSGGDPFSFPVAFVAALQERLASINHIKIWRWHTRIPVVNPESVSVDWLDTFLTPQKQTVVVLHIDHPRELSPATKSLIQQLTKRGVMVLSQTVLLKEVNAEVGTLSQLWRDLLSTGVKPYYLHHLDQAPGTHAYRLSIEEGRALYRSLRGHLTGLALPQYVIDLPGGYGKVPVADLELIGPDTYQVTTFTGQTVRYLDQATPTVT